MKRGCTMPPESRPYNLDLDPFGAKALVKKYDVIYADILRLAGKEHTEPNASVVSSCLSGRYRRRAIFSGLLQALRLRGATDSELTELSLRIEAGLKPGRSAYRYSPVRGDG